MAFQITEIARGKKRQSELIWCSVIIAHLALMALMASKSIKQKSPKAHQSQTIAVKTIALRPKIASKAGQEGQKLPQNAPAKPQLAKPPTVQTPLKRASSTSETKKRIENTATSPSKPLSTTQPVRKASQPDPSSSQKRISSKSTAAAAKTTGSNFQKAPNPTTTHSVLNRQRVEAQKKALALLSNIGDKTPKVPKGAMSTISQDSAAHSLRDLDQDSEYNAQLRAVLESNLQLREDIAVKLKLLINDDGSYAGHQIIVCKSEIDRHTIDCTLPELPFPAPLDGKQLGIRPIILNLKR